MGSFRPLSENFNYIDFIIVVDLLKTDAIRILLTFYFSEIRNLGLSSNSILYVNFPTIKFFNSTFFCVSRIDIEHCLIDYIVKLRFLFFDSNLINLNSQVLQLEQVKKKTINSVGIMFESFFA